MPSSTAHKSSARPRKWPWFPPLSEVPSDLLDTITRAISLTPHRSWITLAVANRGTGLLGGIIAKTTGGCDSVSVFRVW